MQISATFFGSIKQHIKQKKKHKLSGISQFLGVAQISQYRGDYPGQLIVAQISEMENDLA